MRERTQILDNAGSVLDISPSTRRQNNTCCMEPAVDFLGRLMLWFLDWSPAQVDPTMIKTALWRTWGYHSWKPRRHGGHGWSCMWSAFRWCCCE
mmetsp:Transcript_18106/g.49988  ORF Transcript_18106/g.49988 Transcript_18106/m.49988 type:complete len:94 (+) Transcript_18106:599-880(+)